MLETELRRYLQPYIDIIARQCRPLPPDAITGISLVIGISSAYAITNHALYTSIVLLWLSGLFDVIDGSLARLYQRSSPRGMYADLIADRTVEGALALGISAAYPDCAWYTTLFVTGVLLHFSTFMLAAFMFENTGTKSVHYEASIIERSEAFIGITALLLFPHYRIWILGTLSYAIIIVAILRFIRMYHI